MFYVEIHLNSSTIYCRHVKAFPRLSIMLSWTSFSKRSTTMKIAHEYLRRSSSLPKNVLMARDEIHLVRYRAVLSAIQSTQWIIWIFAVLPASAMKITRKKRVKRECTSIEPHFRCVNKNSFPQSRISADLARVTYLSARNEIENWNWAMQFIRWLIIHSVSH